MSPTRTFWIAQVAETLLVVGLLIALVVNASLGLELGLIALAFASRFWALRHTTGDTAPLVHNWYRTPAGWAWVICAAVAVLTSF